MGNQAGNSGLGAAFSGWPSTSKIEDPNDPNKPGVEVRDSCLSPGGAKIAGIMSVLVGFIVGADMAILSMKVGDIGFMIGAVVGVAALVFLTKLFFGWLLSRDLWIRVFEDRVEIAGWAQFKTYEAKIGYSFRLDDHEKAFDEEIKYRQNPQTGRYYSNSHRVFFVHGRQGVFLADVYPKEKARSLHGRLDDIQQGFKTGRFI